METSKRKTCTECKGQKFVRGKPCRTCGGRGWVVPIEPPPEKEGPGKKPPPGKSVDRGKGGR